MVSVLIHWNGTGCIVQDENLFRRLFVGFSNEIFADWLTIIVPMITSNRLIQCFAFSMPESIETIFTIRATAHTTIRSRVYSTRDNCYRLIHIPFTATTTIIVVGWLVIIGEFANRII